MPQDGADFVGREALLGFLRAQMELQQHGNDLAVLTPPLVDRLQQMQRIHALHERHERQHQLQLVGLEMADEMPLHVGGHLRHLGGQFLGAVLAKDALAGVVGLHERPDGMEFGNCHKAHGLWQFL